MNCGKSYEAIMIESFSVGLGRTLVCQIQREMGNFKETNIMNILREDNCCADGLAKLGASYNATIILYDVFPIDVLKEYRADLEGTSKKIIVLL